MPLDENDLKQIGELIGTSIKTVTGELTTSLTKHFEGKLAAQKAELEAKVKPAAGKDPVDPDDDTEEIPPKAGETDADKRVRLLERKFRDAERARKAAEAREKEQGLTNSLRQSLLEAGIDPKRINIAMNHLRAEGRVKFNAAGEPVFAAPNDYGAEELVPVAEGAKRWAGTEEGKTFIPPSDAGGTGDRLHREGGGSNNEADPLATVLGLPWA